MPSATATSRSRFEAATMRTSTLIGRSPPTREKVPVSRTRRSFTCSSKGISPISSRKSVPPSARSKCPRWTPVGAGEAAALVAEELALDEVGGDRAAVDRDHRPRAAPAERVHGLGDQLLAGAALAQDQDRGARSARRGRSDRRASACTGEAPTIDPNRPSPRSRSRSSRISPRSCWRPEVCSRTVRRRAMSSGLTR